MDILALLLYIILAIVLITLVIVIGWLYYDYVELKDNLNSNFSYVRRKFNDHDEKDEDLEEDIGTNNDSIVTIDSTINDKPGGIKEEINEIKTILGEPKSEDGDPATGYFKVKELVGVYGPSLDGSDATGLIQNTVADQNMKSQFHSNLNKYFEFGTTGKGLNDNSPDGEGGKALIGNMWYRAFDDAGDHDNKLKLIQDTTIAANMTINTDSSSNKHLKICNNDSSKCYKLYVDSGGDLNIQSNGTNNLKVGNIHFSDNTVLNSSSDIATNAGNIATNAGNIATNAGNIATNTSDIATNAGNIATNAGNIAS